MNMTKQHSRPVALLTWLLVLAVTCIIALAATSCDSGDKDEPNEPKKDKLHDYLLNYAYAWNLKNSYLDKIKGKNIKSASFFFLPNGNVLQRIVYKTGTTTIRCFSCNTRENERYHSDGRYGRGLIELFLSTGTKCCELYTNSVDYGFCTGLWSENVPGLDSTEPLWYFSAENLTGEDVDFIETYSSMKVGEIKEIGGSGSSTDDDTPTIDSRIIGSWEYNEDGDIYRLTFNKSGYVEERTNADNYEDFSYNKFLFDGKNLTLPDDTPFSNNWGTNFTVTFSGSYMTLSNSLTTSSGVNVRFRKKS